MKVRLFVPIILGVMLLASIAGAQPYTIKGKITDTLNANNLPYGSVVLINAADSVLEGFTRTKQDGSFELHAKTKGKFLIMITFPSFADYVDIVKLEDKDVVDMGEIPMVSRENLLKEFVFTDHVGAIKVKGDTIEYVADSFKVKDNATVEDLLKKLPGLQVNKDGQITAQGEKVQKVLVDGEEFFSDDPAVVTKNLQANAIETVQVFDKKSDQAEFTGIDDGEKIKTINLELKEDKKKGIFGKVVAGGGNDGYFENQAMLNQFKGKRQLSAFGIMANTGKMGLGWEDRDKYGGGGGGTVEVDDDGGVTRYYSSGADNDFESWNGQYNGQGRPRVWTGGLHFADKWNKDINHVSGNYRFSKQDISTNGNTVTQFVLPGGGLNKYETNNSFSSGMRHRGDGLYEWKIDSLSTLKLTASGSYSQTEKTSVYHARSVSAEVDSTDGIADLINETSRSTQSLATSTGQNADLIYRKKFIKKGRSLSVNFNESYKDSHSDDSMSADITAFIDTIPNNSIQDQYRNSESSAFNLSGKINYTEPLLEKKIFLEINYGLNINNSDVTRNTFARAIDGTYTDRIDTLSTDYDYEILTNTGGTNLRFTLDKFNFSFGGSVSNANFKQADRRTDSLPKYNIEYSRLNFFPKATFNYKVNKQSNLYFSYSGATNQPTIDQIQPQRNNTDPLNIAIGNPNLKQEFRHSFTGRFNDYKVLTGRYIWTNISFSTVQDDITMVDNINASGIRTYSYKNINGNYNGWGYIGYGRRINKLDLDAGISANFGITHANTFVNGLKNVSDNNNYGVDVDLRYDKEKKFSINMRAGVTYNDNRATISTNTSSYWVSDNSLEAEVQLPKKFELGTDIEWYIRQRTAVFTTNNNVFRWNAYLSRKFLKKDQLELRAYVFDILNQNRGFQRFAQGNQITEQNYNTINRYGLLSLIWNFSKMAAGAQQPEGPKMEIKL